MNWLASLFTPKPQKTGVVTIRFDSSQVSSAVFASSLESFAHNSKYAPLIQELLKHAQISHDGSTGCREDRINRLKQQSEGKV